MLFFSFCPHCFYTNIVFSVGRFSGEQKKCCLDGLQENSLGYSCERRASFIVDEDECVQAFLICCKEMKHHTDNFGEKEILLARSEILASFEKYVLTALKHSEFRKRIIYLRNSQMLLYSFFMLNYMFAL